MYAWLHRRLVDRKTIVRHLLRNKKKIRQLARKRVRIGRGHSWLPKTVGKRRSQAIPYFEISLKKSAEHWKVMFGQTTPKMIWNIARTLPFFDKRGHKLSPVNRVALFVNRIRTGDTYGKVGARFGISKAIACVYFHKILRKLIVRKRNVIHLPTEHESEQIKQKLAQRGDDLPNVLHVMDCTHTRAMINDGWDSTK